MTASDKRDMDGQGEYRDAHERRLPADVPLTDAERAHGQYLDGTLLFHEKAVGRIVADRLDRRRPFRAPALPNPVMPEEGISISWSGVLRWVGDKLLGPRGTRSFDRHIEKRYDFAGDLTKPTDDGCHPAYHQLGVHRPGMPWTDNPGTGTQAGEVRGLMPRRIEVNPGEFFAVSDRVILVREYESVLGMLGKLGTDENDHFAYLLTFEGKLNNKPRTSSVTVALSPEDALQLVGDLVKGLELRDGARQ